MRFLLKLAVFHSIKPWHNGCLQRSHEQKIDIPMIAFKVSGSSVRVYGGLSGSRSPDSGHVMRCLALAESWHREGGQVTMLSSRLDPGLRKRTETLGIDLAEIPMSHPDTSDLRSSFNALEKLSRSSTDLP